MGDVTKIQWCHHTFNPWVGCSKVHAGCANCYAEADMDKRRHFAVWGTAGTRVRTTLANWVKVMKWNREAEAAGGRRRVFCASLADVFESWDGPILNHSGQKIFIGPDGETMATALDIEHGGAIKIKEGWRPMTLDDVRRDLFELIDNTPWLDWMLLTKRPENVSKMWPVLAGASLAENRARYDCGEIANLAFRDNVWIGTSVSNQATADTMLPELLMCRDLSPVLFVSAEPLLAAIDFQYVLHDGYQWDTLEGTRKGTITRDIIPSHSLDLVIVGGESGPNARSCGVVWVRSIIEQCRETNVSCFVKQLGRDPFWSGPDVAAGWHRSFSDPKGGDPEQWPNDLRVRQIPIVIA